MGNDCCTGLCRMCWGDDGIVEIIKPPSRDDSLGIIKPIDVLRGQVFITFFEEARITDSDKFREETRIWLGVDSNPGISRGLNENEPFKFDTSMDSNLPFYKIKGSFPDGSILKYFGQVKDEKAEGKGFMLLEGKSEDCLIISNFKEGRASGDGSMYFSNGNYFNGTVEKEAMIQGKMILNNGNTYAGRFSNNEYEGQGTLTFKDGRVYTGCFVKGMKQGYGVMNKPDGSKYSGQWFEDKKHGKGIIKKMHGSAIKVTYSHGLKTELEY